MNLLAIALWVLAEALAQDMYSDKYDHINLDEVLGNDLLLDKYVECFLAEGEDKCTEDAEAVKRVLSEILTTDCTKCTDKQKNGTEKVVKHLVEFKPDVWKSLVAKYDPSGEFLKKHPEFAVKV